MPEAALEFVPIRLALSVLRRRSPGTSGSAALAAPCQLRRRPSLPARPSRPPPSPLLSTSTQTDAFSPGLPTTHRQTPRQLPIHSLLHLGRDLGRQWSTHPRHRGSQFHRSPGLVVLQAAATGSAGVLGQIESSRHEVDLLQRGVPRLLPFPVLLAVAFAQEAIEASHQTLQTAQELLTLPSLALDPLPVHPLHLLFLWLGLEASGEGLVDCWCVLGISSGVAEVRDGLVHGGGGVAGVVGDAGFAAGRTDAGTAGQLVRVRRFCLGGVRGAGDAADAHILALVRERHLGR